MTDKKGKVSLSGLSKGGGSAISFRFSPESEEIEEILQDELNVLPAAHGCSESAPASPKPSPGDVSPLKEYFIKEKHKWANKWDKKSMSLDLDLKGKIFTAIEDKKKSIFSNFIPEEAGVLSQSQSIPENIATRVYSGVPEDNNYPSSSNGSSSCQGATAKQTYGNDYKHPDDYDIKSDSPEGSTATEVEEIGIDMTNYVSNSSSAQDIEDGSPIDEMLKFCIPPENLQELFGGLPTLYQPTSVISGIRATPLEHGPVEELEDPASSGSSTPLSSQASQETVTRKEDLSVATLFMDIISDIVFHPWSRYWIALIAGSLVLPLWGFFSALCWFLVGGLSVIIVGRGLTGSDDENQKSKKTGTLSNLAPENKTFPTEIMYKELKLPTKSQGWMTQMDGDYDVSTCHFRRTKVVFVRLDESNLYLSYPHHRHRIPKRRLWSDPAINMEHMFIRHKVYSISGAEISIVPVGLAKKRAWNKKYPIGITFPKWSVYSQVTPLPSVDSLLGTVVETTVAANTSTNTTVNYNVNTSGVSVNKQSEISKQVVKKEIAREDCGSKSIFLFARCDREKDDWYRRLVAGTKTGASAPSNSKKSPTESLAEYRDYMKRVCPALIPFLYTITNTDGWDNVSINAEPGSNKSDNNSKDTPSSSRKSTPEKEKPPTSKNDSVQSDLENIVTIQKSPAYLNAFIGRLFFDFLKSPYWTAEVTKLIDKKLFYMKKPAFVEDIYVKELEMGNAVPTIQRASAPLLDNQGLWIDLDITYEGTFCVALETHVNLLKLRKPDTDSDDTTKSSGNSKNSQNPTAGGTNNSGSPSTSRSSKAATSPQKSTSAQPKRSHVFDSDADDSGESSEDEADAELETATLPIIPDVDPNIQTKGHKFMKMAEKFAASAIMNTGYVKKMVDNLGNTPLVLSVELRSCTGTLAINIPPPPNDRIWLGFRTNPNMQIIAKPKFGDRTLNLTHLTDWIKKKILLEFQRVAVCPNMTDLTIPLMEFDMPK